MPELPEVETTARLIRPRVGGRRIVAAEVAWTRTLGGSSRRTFAQAVVGARIADVSRRAKYVRIDLERDGRAAGALLIHLRMSGRLLVAPRSARAQRHVRVRLGLDDGQALDFLDVRKFGRLVFVRDADAHLARLGPEPLGDAFSVAWFRAALAGRARVLKPLLLDQTFLAGLGNIYVDEALYRARLHPLRRADSLRAPAVRALHGAIREVLAAAIEKQGSSFDGFYRTPEGLPGAYQSEFAVYGRKGLPCPRCGTPIRRLVVGQRGTHVCPRCQRAPRARVRAAREPRGTVQASEGFPRRPPTDAEA